MTPFEKRLNDVRFRLRSRRLGDIVKALEKTTPRYAGNRGINLRNAFNELKAAVAKGAGEQLLYEMNVPPLECDEISGRQSGFFEISRDIFNLNPELPTSFAPDLFNACTATPTHLVLALGHADSVSVLVKQNVANVNLERCIQILPGCNDTRALYALKVLQWYSCWDTAAPLVFDLLLSSEKAIAMEAYWTLVARASQSQLVALCLERGLSLPPDLLRTGNVQNFLNALVRILARG
jgi:hypothetical protein